MAAIALTLTFTGSGAADVPSSTDSGRAKEKTALRVVAPEKCASARKAVRSIGAATLKHREKMGAGRPGRL